jgi:putative aminopeptidase FrvX
MKLDFSLLQDLIKIKSPSGEEIAMKNFLLEYFANQKEFLPDWEIIGSPVQDCLIMKKGNPEIAFIAHMDTVGFTARYENQLVPIGSPEVGNGSLIEGQDNHGLIECSVSMNFDGKLLHDFGRPIDRGTSLVFKPVIDESSSSIRAPYLDDRVGIFLLLQLAQNMDNGLLVFSCWEEVGGGSIPYLARILYEDFRISEVIIADVTWVTDGVLPGQGSVISLRDRNIPRRSYIDKIIETASRSSCVFQLEVEGEGSSDGGEIQRTPYPIDWAFIGPPVENTHSSGEKVHKKDIISTLEIYHALTLNL